MHGITETASTLAAEPGRAARVPAGVLRAVDMPAAANAPATLGSIARAELRRAPTIPALVRRTPDAATIRRDAATIAREVFGDGTPLDEIDDARHRTDPLDDRPEATLWQRIRRRLHL